jgi:small subunit ribosomal protein S2
LYITERWLGGLLTNFQTVKKQVRRMKELESGTEEGGEFENYTKRNSSCWREREKLSKYLYGIRTMTRLPGILFVGDSKKERIAVAEANNRHSHDAIVDTNADPISYGADRRQRRRDPFGRVITKAIATPSSRPAAKRRSARKSKRARVTRTARNRGASRPARKTAADVGVHGAVVPSRKRSPLASRTG